MRMTKKEMINEMIVTFEKQLTAFTGRKLRLLVVDYNKADESHLSRPEIEEMMKRNIELAFGIPSFSIANQTRRRPYPEARFCYFFIHKQYFPKYNLSDLALQLGYATHKGIGDHTSSLYGIQKHKDLYEVDDIYKVAANRAFYYIEKALTEKVESI